MKNWIKKTLISVFSLTLLTGVVAGCSRDHHSDWSAEDSAGVRDKIADKLDLNTPQRQKLTVLIDRLLAVRKSVRGDSADPRSTFATLISGDTFDRTKARALLDEKTRALEVDGPATITALADFYDSLDTQQQAKVREKLEPGHGWFH
jgi:Spy/CpxP family protein refolding chaperone